MCYYNGDRSNGLLLRRTVLAFSPHVGLHNSRSSSVFAATVSYSLAISQLVQKAHAHLENEIACISLNPPSNQPSSVADAVTTAMECEEGSKLDALVAVGMWTDMTVSSTIHTVVFLGGIHAVYGHEAVLVQWLYCHLEGSDFSREGSNSRH